MKYPISKESVIEKYIAIGGELDEISRNFVEEFVCKVNEAYEQGVIDGKGE